MADFGWSYPPGCNSVPGDEDEPNENLPTIREFCDHVGVAPIWQCLRAIDRYGTHAVDIKIEGTDEWLTCDDRRKLETASEHDPIAQFRVRGIAWDCSDWEFCEIVYGEDGLGAVDQARANFETALEEYEAERDAEAYD